MEPGGILYLRAKIKFWTKIYCVFVSSVKIGFSESHTLPRAKIKF
jgi:hypothetical protein